MKKTIVTVFGAVGMAAGVFAQGSVLVDNTAPYNPGLSIGASQAAGQGNSFSGNYTFQVWYLNAASVPSNVTSDSNLTTTGLTAYNNLTSDGFTLAATYTDQNITAGNAGAFSLGELDIPGITPAGSTEVFALVSWAENLDGSGTPSATFGGYGGVFAFLNPTANYTTPPPNTPTPAFLTGWAGGNDLVMVPVSVPEPATLALASLGGLSLLALRRRKA